MKECVAFLLQNTIDGILPLSAQVKAAGLFSLSFAQVEEITLANNLMPSRYQRNRNIISIEQQLSLLRSKVAVIGCGGLGGYIIEELARLGVGTITVVDPDVFEEHNLNRQLFCTKGQLGKKKVSAAALRVAEINPSVEILKFSVPFDRDNSGEILSGVNVAVDALDSILCRFELGEACSKMDIPLVHGAIAGWAGFMAVQYPGENILQHLYPDKKTDQGVEQLLGNPSFTPAVVASLEVAEVVKILLKIEPQKPRKYLAIDLYHSEFTEILFPGRNDTPEVGDTER